VGLVVRSKLTDTKVSHYENDRVYQDHLQNRLSVNAVIMRNLSWDGGGEGNGRFLTVNVLKYTDYSSKDPYRLYKGRACYSAQCKQSEPTVVMNMNRRWQTAV